MEMTIHIALETPAGFHLGQQRGSWPDKSAQFHQVLFAFY